MKKLVTIGFYLLLLALWQPTTLLAQPANDNVCNALEITLDGPAVVTNNLGATAEPGENTLLPAGPPEESIVETLCGPGGWCDQFIAHTLWYKFTAPSTTAVNIDICSSDFDTQMGLFEVGDCADFNSFNLIYAMDDLQGCGIAAGLSSSISIQCLNPGQVYYVVVDDWQQNVGDLVDTGDVVITIETRQFIDQQMVLSNNPTITSPSCPGGGNGAIDITYITGVPPISYQWDTPNGDTTPDVSGLPAGTYSVTATDFCQSSTTATYTIEDPSNPPALSLDQSKMQVVHPTNCGDDAYGGQIIAAAVSGVLPYTYQWSHDNSINSPMVQGLADGEYTLTITDGCDVNPSSLIHTFYVGASAGPDIEAPETCGAVPIGLEQVGAGGKATKFTYNTNQDPGGNVHCRFNAPPEYDGSISESTHWRSYSLSDFDIAEGAKLSGIEIFVQLDANTTDIIEDQQPGGLPLRMDLYLTNTTELDSDNLLLSAVDSVTVVLDDTDIDGSYMSLIVPFDPGDIGPDDFIAVAVTTLGTGGPNHFFNLGANNTPTPGYTTYLSGCDDFPTPVKLSDLGNFDQETIINLIFTEGGLTHEWAEMVSDPNSATPLAEGEGRMDYIVTITDSACENFSVTDTVEVECWTVSTENPLVDNLEIFPNPSSGQFSISNEGPGQNQLLQVLNVQGKVMYAEQLFLGPGASKTLNLEHLSKGIYLAQFSNETEFRNYKLVIQ